MFNSEKLKTKEQQIRQQLLGQGISIKEANSIITNLKEESQKIALPTMAFIGFTGVGKTTTLNSLFNAGQPTSAICACTQFETPIIGDVGKFTGSKGSVIIYDMPGLGEDINADLKHFDTYKKVLPLVDIAVWTFHTGDRAMTPMQEALIGLIKYLGNDFSKKLVFAINKADAIAPGEASWNTTLNSPSAEQRRNINELEAYIRGKIRQVLPNWNGQLITYSAKTRYRLEQLMTAMVETIAVDRRWVLDSVADVANPLDLMDPNYRSYVNSLQKTKKVKL